MTDSIAAIAAVPEAAGAVATAHAARVPLATAPAPDALDVRDFSALMQRGPSGSPLAPDLVAATKDLAAKLGSKPHTIEELRRGMLDGFDARDPIKTMFVMTDHAMQAHSMFARLHISTGLAQAATSLFGGLLRNQQ